MYVVPLWACHDDLWFRLLWSSQGNDVGGCRYIEITDFHMAAGPKYFGLGSCCMQGNDHRHMTHKMLQTQGPEEDDHRI